MTPLEITIHAVLNQLKLRLAAETWQSRRRYCNQMLQCAKSLGITAPCAELYTAYIADDHDSTERRSLHIRCVKLIDKFACTHARDEKGILFNEPPMPEAGEVLDYFDGQNYPISNSVPLDCLIVKAELEMEYLQLTTSTMGQYKHAWMDIRRFFFDNGHTLYTETLVQEYLERIDDSRGAGAMKEWKWKINRKAAYVLIEVAKTGTFRWKHIHSGMNHLSPDVNTIRSLYLRSLTERNLSKNTIALHDYVFRRMIAFLEIISLRDFDRMTVHSIQCAVTRLAGVSSKRSMATLIPIFRSILVFLQCLGLTEQNFSGVIMSACVQKHSVAAYLSEADQARLISQLDGESRRTKAIMLLALKLGLRDSDICNLTFREIDWKKDQIRLRQQKTGELLVLPLLADVGNALMDYILNERPKRDDFYPYVFLRKQAPYNRLTSVYCICSKLLEQQKIEPINGSAKGTHLFRYSLVHRLLAAKVPHQVITNVLGHTSKEADKPYLSMEVSFLRMCALDLSVIGRISWKGGPSDD